MISPCVDHDTCDLDLEALRRSTFAVFQRRMDLRRGLKELRLQFAKLTVQDLAYPGVLKAIVNHESELYHLTREQRLLYATRAHHRGKVHELAAKRYQLHSLPNDNYFDFVKRMLPLQAEEVAATWARFVRKPRAVAE